MQVSDLLKELKRDFLPSPVAALLQSSAGSDRARAENESAAASSTVGLGLSAMLNERRNIQQTDEKEPESPEVVLNVDDSFTSGVLGSETSDEDDSYLWDSWKQNTGGSHSWRQRMRQRRQEHDTDNASVGSEDKSLSHRSTDSEGYTTCSLMLCLSSCSII